MATVPHAFVTVDMRDLKAPLAECARGRRVSVSALVRECVAVGLGLTPTTVSSTGSPLPDRLVKLSIRLTRAEADELVAGATRAGLSRAAYLAELISAPGRPVRPAATEQLAMLAASNSELSTLSRSVRHLSTLIGHGSTQAAREYGAMLDTIARDVRLHLSLASAQLADLQSRRRNTRPS